MNSKLFTKFLMLTLVGFLSFWSADLSAQCTGPINLQNNSLGTPLFEVTPCGTSCSDPNCVPVITYVVTFDVQAPDVSNTETFTITSNSSNATPYSINGGVAMATSGVVPNGATVSITYNITDTYQFTASATSGNAACPDLTVDAGDVVGAICFPPVPTGYPMPNLTTTPTLVCEADGFGAVEVTNSGIFGDLGAAASQFSIVGVDLDCDGTFTDPLCGSFTSRTDEVATFDLSACTPGSVVRIQYCEQGGGTFPTGVCAPLPADPGPCFVCQTIDIELQEDPEVDATVAPFSAPTVAGCADGSAQAAITFDVSPDPDDCSSVDDGMAAEVTWMATGSTCADGTTALAATKDAGFGTSGTGNIAPWNIATENTDNFITTYNVVAQNDGCDDTNDTDANFTVKVCAVPVLTDETGNAAYDVTACSGVADDWDLFVSSSLTGGECFDATEFRIFATANGNVTGATTAPTAWAANTSADPLASNASPAAFADVVGETLTNLTIVDQVVTYTIEARNGDADCTDCTTSITINVTVEPVLDFNANSPRYTPGSNGPTFCPGDNIRVQAGTTPVGGDIEWEAVTTTPANVTVFTQMSGNMIPTGPGAEININVLDNAAVNETGDRIEGQFNFTIDNGNCDDATDMLAFTICPKPVLTAGMDNTTTICSGESYVVNILSNLNADETEFDFFVSQNNMILNERNGPDLSAGDFDETMGATYTTNTATGDSFSWTSNAITNQTATLQCFDITVSATNSTCDDCPGEDFMYTVCVEPEIDVEAPAGTTTFCSAEGPASIALTTDPAGAGISYMILGADTDGTFMLPAALESMTCDGSNITGEELDAAAAAAAMGVAPNGVATASSFNFTVPENTGNNDHTYFVKFTADDDCDNSCRIVAITVNPQPVLTAIDDIRFCEGDAASIPSTLTVTSTLPGFGIDINSTGVGCSGTNIPPGIDLGLRANRNATACDDAGADAINIVDGDAADMDGVVNGVIVIDLNNANLATFNPGTTAMSRGYEIIPYSDGCCVGEPIDFEFIIDPEPEYNDGGFPTFVCSGASVNINLQDFRDPSSPVATDFSWVATSPAFIPITPPLNGEVAGFTANQAFGAATTMINDVYTLPSGIAGCVEYVITPRFLNSAECSGSDPAAMPCDGDPFTVNVCVTTNILSVQPDILTPSGSYCDSDACIELLDESQVNLGTITAGLGAFYDYRWLVNGVAFDEDQSDNNLITEACGNENELGAFDLGPNGATFCPNFSGAGTYIVCLEFFEDQDNDGQPDPGGCVTQDCEEYIVYPEFDPTPNCPTPVCGADDMITLSPVTTPDFNCLVTYGYNPTSPMSVVLDPQGNVTELDEYAYWTGEGVTNDPNAATATFDAAAAVLALTGGTADDLTAPLTVTLEYHVGYDQCRLSQVCNIVIEPTLSAELVENELALECATSFTGVSISIGSDPNILSFYTEGTYDLSTLYAPSTTEGGTWTLVSQPPSSIAGDAGTIIGTNLFYSDPGAYVLTYTVEDGTCDGDRAGIVIFVSEDPVPAFDLPDNVCWDGIANSVTYDIPNNYYTAPLNYTQGFSGYTSSDDAVASVTPLTGIVTVTGSGSAEICLVETKTQILNAVTIPATATFPEINIGPFFFGIFPLPTVSLTCSETVCQTITVTTTNTDINPSWSNPGPLCVDALAVDLDDLLSTVVGDEATTGGVFTGAGVTVDGTHPNYEFNPATAGVGIHNVCYTVGATAGCDLTECYNIIVLPRVPQDLLVDDFQICLEPQELITLADITNPGIPEILATAGLGSVSIGTSGDLAVVALGDDLIRYDGGCGDLTVTAFTNDCDGTVIQETVVISISQKLEGSFSIPADKCQDEGNFFINNGVVQLYGCTNTVVTFEVISGPEANDNDLIGGAIETRGINAAGEMTGGPVLIMPGAVQQGTYRVRMTMTDPNSVCEPFIYEQEIIIHRDGDPSWTVPGPLCTTGATPVTATLSLDNENDVDGNPLTNNNVFWSGEGVTDGPDLTGSFEANMGAGVYTVCVTVGDARCEETECHDIVVNMQPVIGTATNVHIECTSDPNGTVSIFDLYPDTNDDSGTFALVGAPTGAYISGDALVYNAPGCYEVTYSITGDAPCTDVGPVSAFVYVSEQPEPAFDLAEETCWDGSAGVTIAGLLQSTDAGYVTNPTRTWTSSDNAVATVAADGSGNPIVTIVDVTSATGSNTIQICLEEDIDNPACTTYPSQECTATVCHTITITETSVAVNSSWTNPGPFCYDDMSVIDLTANVADAGGTPGGVFTGTGVAGTHPNYTFTPATAGEGIHVVCYTVGNGAGCDAVECYNIEILPHIPADITDRTVCGEEEYDLSGMYLDNNTTTGGTWEYQALAPGQTEADVDPLAWAEVVGDEINGPNATTTLGLGLYAIQYTVGGATVCPESDIALLTIYSLSLTASHVDPECAGTEDGTMTVTVSGGVAPYTYAWSTGTTNTNVAAATNTESWLHAGGYSVTVTDANGCTAEISDLLKDPKELSMEVIVNNQPWCNGDANGEISLGILQTSNLGGTPPYTLVSIYQNGVSVTAYFPSLPMTFSGNTLDIGGFEAGQYSFLVKDDNGCEVGADVTIDEPHVLIAETIAKTDALCYGSSDGTATVNATGGTTGYTYEWSNGQTTATATGLAAGTYTVTVEDANDCTATAVAIIGQPDELELTLAGTQNVSCNEGSDGAIYMSVAGGTGPYNYDWSGLQPADNVQDALHIPAGTYSVTVTDANGCTDVVTGVVITEPDPISIDMIDVTNADCAGNETGSATATASGGTGMLTYAWSNGDNTPTADELHAGGYSVTVTDANGCTAQASVSITDPNGLVMIVSDISDVTCDGGTDGTVSVQVSGGTSPYTFSSPLTGSGSTATTSGLAAGSYVFTATDDNGCVVSVSAQIDEPTLLIAEIIATTDALCNGSSDGTATVNATGGTTGYTYEWSDGQATATATGLAAGTYTVTVTDANDCTAETTATIGEPSAIVATIDMVTNVSCADGADGSIFIDVTGGTPPYSYNWSASADDVQDATGLVAGTYSVTITDSNGCTAEILDIVITQPTPVTVSIGNVMNADCAGNETGSATATGMGGTGTITYAWSNGDVTATASALHAGGYSVTATDANGCTAQASVSITDPTAMSLEALTNTSPSCNGGTDGSVTLAILTTGNLGGTPPYTLVRILKDGVDFSFPGTPFPGTNGNNPLLVSGLGAGQYSFIVSDDNGCEVVEEQTINEPTLLIAEIISTTDALCNGSADGTATVNATGGTTGYTYLWSDGQTTATATGLAAGTYTVVVTDANACTAEATATIGEPTAVVATIDVINDVTCTGEADGSIYIDVVGGTAPYSYNWSASPDDVQDATGLTAGTYSVVITDSNGCTTSLTNIVVNEPTPIVLEITDLTSADCAGTANGSATVGASGGTSPYDFDWSTGLSVVNLTSSTAIELTAGGYSVTVTDANGCTEEISLTITDPLALEANISAVMDVTCYGGNDGSATVNASGGAGTYTYLWSDGQTTATAINLSAGLYTVLVSDPMGTMCDVIVSVSIDEPTDDINPTLSCPTNVTLTCGQGIPATLSVADLIAGVNGSSLVDNCTTDPADFTLTVADIDNGLSVCVSDGARVITRTYTVIDEAGNSSSCTQTITFEEDTTGPMVTAPADITVDCEDISNTSSPAAIIANFLSGATASDDCSSQVTLTNDFDNTSLSVCSSATSNFCSTPVTHFGGNAESEILLTVENVGGNIEVTATSGTSSPIDFLLIEGPGFGTVTSSTVVDGEITVTIPFVGTPPADFEFQALWSLEDFGGNWQLAVPSTFASTPFSGSCSPVNSNFCSQSITHFGGNPANSEAILTVENVGGNIEVTATSGTSSPIDFLLIEGPSFATITSTTVVNGEIKVTIPFGGTPPTDFEFQLLWSLEDFGGNWQLAVPSTFASTPFNGTCIGAGDNIITVTWTATDDCGNTGTATSTITVEPDTEAPMITAPADVTLDTDVNCNALLPDYTSTPATDGCDTDVQVTQSPLPGTALSAGTTMVTLTATDNCGNFTDVTFNVTVEDNTNPVALCQDFTVQLDAAGNATITAADVDNGSFDNCSVTTVAIDVASFTCADLGSDNQVTLTVTDGAGNTATCIANVTVEDNIAPTFTCPSPVDVQGCDGLVPDLISTIGDEMDNCGAVTLTQNPLPGVSIGNNGNSVDVVITATDDSGNATTCTVTVTVVDDTAPVFQNCPAAISVANDPDQCGAIVSWIAPVALDNCVVMGSGSVVLTAGMPSGSVFPVGTSTVTYTATDDDGNTATCTFDITVSDTEAPEFITTLPADETVECDAIPDPFVVIPMMHTADNCTASADITVDYMEEIIDMVCANTYTIVRTWTITDAAGNSAVHKQKVYVQDTTAPTFTVPADVTIECDEDTTPANTGDVTDAADNCDPTPVVAFTDVEDLTGCGGYTGTITRTWTVTDACGNETVKVQVITIEDTTGPNAVCQNITVELDNLGEVIISANQINNGSTDNCADASTLTLALSQSSFTCADIGDNLVTLTVTDPCGNIGTCVATVTVEDNIAPVIACPADMVIHLDPGACEQVLSFDVLATDNCDVTVTQIAGLFDSGDGFPIGGPYVLTYEATDEGGNTAECSFSVTVFEYVPTSNDLTCNSLVNLSLDENCQAIITADQILEGNNYGCYDDYIITSEDANGNIIAGNVIDITHVGTTITVTITDPVTGISCWGDVYVEDKVIPEFDCPADITIACSENAVPALTGAPVITSCELSHTVTSVDVFTDFGQCSDPRAMIERTWTVTDDSGNSATCVQIITIAAVDLADVTFPTDLIDANALECSDVANDPTLTDSDNTGFPTINGLEITNSGLCMASINVSDEIYDICEGSYEIVRTWKVRNMCLPIGPGNPVEHIQVIKVLDTEGPVVVAPADITISTSSASCETGFTAPAANITDGCSTFDVVTDTPFGSITDNGGPLGQALGLGTHTITYIATDGCGNVGFDEMIVTVADQVAPIAICDEHTSVAIGTDGTASVDALTFDDGSFDNCSDVTFSVRKVFNACNPSNTSFGPSVSFCCAEVGTTVMVELRVTDAAGNINACMVEVEVEDKINPTVICAADKDVECSETYLDYIEVGQSLPQDAIDANGEAIASDNCTGVTLTNNVIGNTVDCGTGTITIVWTATDGGGRTSSCIQRYFVGNNSPFYIADTEHRLTSFNFPDNLVPNPGTYPYPTSGLPTLVGTGTHTVHDGVEWPADLELTTCGLGLEPTDLVGDYPLDAYPQIFEGACNNIAVGHEDQVLDFGVADACLKVLRKWHVIDWCQADANQDPTQIGPGVWHYTQIIKVINSNDPTVTVVDLPAVIDNYDEDCGNVSATFEITADDDCTAQADLQVTWEFSRVLLDAFGNPLVPEQLVSVSTGSGFSASGSFANGYYKLVYTVSDGCDNTVWETHYFTVKDSKKPTPVCIFGIATTIMPSSGEVIIWASDFESGSSYDNCTDYDNLQFSFSQDVTLDNITITCDDIPAGGGMYPITLYVTDEAGNFDFCTTFIDVQDPNIACPGPTSLITGTIENEFQEVIEEVTVTLSDDNGMMTAPVVTGPTGIFQFNENYGDYDVTPEKDINYLNGVTTYDLVLISKHILGLELLDSPYKIIAADANNSETITALDLVKIRALILYLDDELSNNTSWRFVEQDYVFPDPTNPWLEEFPEYIGLTSTAEPVNFIATKIGDVNGSASPNSLLGSDTRTFSGNLALQLEATKVAEGETFTVDFKAKDFKQIAGYQFTLGFDNDAVEFVDVTTNLEGLESKNFGLTKLEEGAITTSWNSSAGVDVEDNTVLFSMTFSANTTVNTADVFTINSRYTESEAYNGTDLFDVVLEFNGNEVASVFELYQNIPNPFKEETTISFNLPEAGAVTLRITDVAGRTLKLINLDEAVKGMNSVKLNRDEFDATGVLYYQLESANNTATMKMIIVD